MRVRKELVIEPAQSWARLQQLKNSEWFIHDLEEQLKENHRIFLEELMRYERQQHLGVAAPYERRQERADQANGFYQRTLLTRLGAMELAIPRSRSGLFQSQVIPRYQRREAAVDEALRKVFLLGVSTRQAGPALASLLDEAVSAATVSAVSKVLDQTVTAWHRRTLSDTYRYLILDAVSVRIRLVGTVQRRVALCVYGVSEEGKRELIDFLIRQNRKPGTLAQLVRRTVATRLARHEIKTHQH
jgi:transposase-like protein